MTTVPGRMMKPRRGQKKGIAALSATRQHRDVSLGVKLGDPRTYTQAARPPGGAFPRGK